VPKMTHLWLAVTYRHTSTDFFYFLAEMLLIK